LAAAARPALSDEQLQELLALVDDSDSVELKLTVPDADQRSAVEALGMDPLQGQLRQVFFFDTPDLALYGAGVVARARRVQKRGDDSVVKLRPVVPSQLSEEVRASPNMFVEVDAMPGGYVCSASMKRDLGTTTAVRACARGERKLRKLFSKEQRAFLAEHAPEGIELDDLKILGPINVLKLKFAPEGYKRRMVAELWMYPNYTRILELSTKCSPEEAFDVAARSRAFLVKQGVNVTGEQQTKTRTALKFFAKRSVDEDLQEDQDQTKRRTRKPRTQRLEKSPAGKLAQTDAPDEQQPDVQQDGNPQAGPDRVEVERRKQQDDGGG
jgi:hypothetical protein